MTRASWARALRSWLVFPIAVVVVFLTLVALNVNGSSMAVIADRGTETGVLAGDARAVRSDEFQLRTPIAISSVRQGFPSRPWIGLSRVDQSAVAHGGPVREWSSAFRPQDWGYLAGSSARGLAWSWWWSFAASLVGSFAFMAVLTRRRGIAAVVAMVVTFAPYTAWWTAPQPALFIGYACGAAALVLAALETKSRRTALALAISAGAVGTMFALALYPPWQLSLAIVVGAACIGFAIDVRSTWRRVAFVVGVAATTTGMLVGAWAFAHREAIRTTAQTVYPGGRRSEAGTGSLAQLLDAPVNFWMAGQAGATLGYDGRGGPYANASELASSWFVAPLVVLLAAASVSTVVSWRRSRGQDRHPAAPGATMAATSLALGVLLVWTFAPLPRWLGSITLLDRVQPSRTPLALGLGFMVLVGLAAALRDRPPVLRAPWLACAAVLSAVGSVAVAHALPWDTGLISLLGVAASAAVLAVGVCLLASGRGIAVAGPLLALYALVSWGIVNPLSQGIQPLVASDLAGTLAEVGQGSDNRRVEVFGGLDLVASVRAAGMQSVAGTTPYPDVDLMQSLAPGQRALWNNYAQYIWEPAAEGQHAQIAQVQGTAMRLLIDPCDDVLLREVNPGWVVSSVELPHSCLAPSGSAKARDGAPLWLYSVD